MPNLPMMKVQAQHRISVIDRVRAHSWGLELSCDFEIGLIDHVSNGPSTTLKHLPISSIEACQMNIAIQKYHSILRQFIPHKLVLLFSSLTHPVTLGMSVVCLSKLFQQHPSLVETPLVVPR